MTTTMGLVGAELIKRSKGMFICVYFTYIGFLIDIVWSEYKGHGQAVLNQFTLKHQMVQMKNII